MTEKLVVYLIPAPDMDERAIDGLRSDSFDFVRVNVPALTYKSKLSDVTEQIAAQIDGESPILLSFCSSGVLAIEVAKIIKVHKTIVVSGIKSSQQLVLSRKMLASLFIVVPEWSLRALWTFITFLINRIMRINVKIPRVWLKVGQNKFILRHALKLSCLGVNGEIVRIHGDSDLIVPLAGTDADYVIPGGGHFMFVYQRKELLQAIDHAIRQRNHRQNGREI